MAPIEDHVYMKLCSELASCLSISLASARRKVELVVAREGVKDLNDKKTIAESLLNEARQKMKDNSTPNQLDQLLTVLPEEENFMTED